MDKYLFIAEKPSLMRAVRDTYKKHIKEINDKVGEIDFMALHGHACRYITPKEYDEWDCKWEDIELPMIPKIFKIDKIPGNESILKEIKTAVASKKYAGIIVGTDADDEGNGIYYLIANHLHLTNFPALRFFEQGLTEESILSSLLSLTDFWKNERDVRMTNAYKLRSQRDWLIGMNFSVGFTVKAGFLMKVGSVKAATLKLIYDNCKAIDDFVPHTDFELTATFDTGEKKEYSGVLLNDEGGTTRFEAIASAEAFAKKITDPFKLTDVQKKKVSTEAPQLYKLADIQTEAGSMYGYSLDKTLDIIQSLYEKKYVSYPRTNGRYISTEKAKELPQLLKAVGSHPDLKSYVSKINAEDIKRITLNKKIVNDAEVAKESHDALIPTSEIPDYGTLSKDEANILLLIYKRLLAVFLPPLVEEKTVVFTKSGDYTFKTNGKIVKDIGWTVLYEKRLQDSELPDLRTGMPVRVKKYSATEKTTTPPKRFTQATLGQAMENIHKYITNKDLKDVMKLASGIGQPSSRGTIIKELFTTGYVEEKGKSKGIYMTDSGKKYIETIMPFSVAQPEINAEFETKKNAVRRGEEKYEVVQKEILSYINSIIKELDAADIKKSWVSKGSSVPCPICGAPAIKGRFGYFCSKKNEGCTFSISETIAGKKLSKKNMNDLITKKKTGKISGFTSKKGTKFDAKLKLNKDGKVEFDFG